MRDILVNNFLQISKIPRGSGNEKGISDYFVQIAKKHGLYYYQDENYNVLIKKPGSIKGEPIAFQAHLDMVCAKKEDSKHDFTKDGIDVIIDGNKVYAKDTTLGADQGVGLSLMLALIEDKDIKLPDLEFLFTVEEETTYKGAITFPYSKVTSKKMINLDYCLDDAIVIGSAGDEVNEYIYEGTIEENELPSYKITIDGIPGGNSGEKIEESANNAIAIMAKMLEDKGIYISSINGGTYENDIATSCEAIIKSAQDINELFSKYSCKIEETEYKKSFSKDDSNKIIKGILKLKNGYITKTSSGNTGIIKTKDNLITITHLYRSSEKEELENFSKNKEIGNNYKTNMLYKDSIWKLSDDSKLFQIYKETYHDLFNEKPKEITAQGGLEIASIQKRIPGLDIISLGANMENIHTVEEITYIDSWEKIYSILLEIISRIL